MPSRAELYRQRAQECQALAETATDHNSKLQLQGAVKQWLELAEQVEFLEYFDVR